MRLLGITFVLLLLTAAGARADVFVPDDPSTGDAGCVAAAGDAIVTVHAEDADVATLQVSTAGGPPQQLPAGTLDECPKAVAAADGTVAIAAGRRLYVRRGGSFGAPVELPYDNAEDVAVAPGGWVVATGTKQTSTRHASHRELFATTVAPDGTARSTLLARSNGTLQRELNFPIGPRAGIDAQGRATVAWTVFRTDAHGYDVVGATPGAPSRVIARVTGPASADVDVAVTPSGHTMLAWTDRGGIAASFDGGAAQRVNQAFPDGPLRAELAEDGAALLAYRTSEAILVSDRAGSGPWVTHALAQFAYNDHRGESDDDLWTALAPDGRVAVAWMEARRVMAATGRLGGAWTPGVGQSAVTRAAGSSSLTLTPGGDPRLVWSEFGQDGPSRVRGARLSAEPVADTTAPVLAAALPSRTPRTKTGKVTLRVPVTCSEACDARVELVDGHRRLYASTVRELAAGRQETLTLPLDAFAGMIIAGDRRLRRPRLELVVTDRANNVVRRSGRVAFRIVERPLLDYRVTLNHDFEMYSKAGNRAVARLVNRLITGLARGTIKSRRELRRQYVHGSAAIRRQYDAIDGDDAVEAIYEALYVPLKRKGYDPDSILDY